MDDTIIRTETCTTPTPPLRMSSRSRCCTDRSACKTGFLCQDLATTDREIDAGKAFQRGIAARRRKSLVSGMDTSSEENTGYKKNGGDGIQNPDNQIVANVVEEDVAFLGESRISHRGDTEKVDDALKAVDMYDMRTHAPHLLSGGQKQRIAITGSSPCVPGASCSIDDCDAGPVWQA